VDFSKAWNFNTRKVKCPPPKNWSKSDDSIGPIRRQEEWQNRRTKQQNRLSSNCAKHEVLLGQGKNFKEASRAIEISEQTYYRWRKVYEGLDTTTLL